MTAIEWVTLLASGDTVFVYAPGDPNISAMEAVLDATYPASAVVQQTISVEAWESAKPKMGEAGVRIVDVRAGAGE